MNSFLEYIKIASCVPDYINPCSSIPASSVSIAAGSACGCAGEGAGVSGLKSAVSIELIIVLKSSNLSAGIRRPFFVGPVYCSL